MDALGNLLFNGGAVRQLGCGCIPREHAWSRARVGPCVRARAPTEEHLGLGNVVAHAGVVGAVLAHFQVQSKLRVTARDLARTVLLETVLAAAAGAAAVDEAPHAHAIADLVLGDAGAHGLDDAGNLMPRHHGVHARNRPFSAALVHVRVADACDRRPSGSRGERGESARPRPRAGVAR